MSVSGVRAASSKGANRLPCVLRPGPGADGPLSLSAWHTNVPADHSQAIFSDGSQNKGPMTGGRMYRSEGS